MSTVGVQKVDQRVQRSKKKVECLFLLLEFSNLSIQQQEIRRGLKTNSLKLFQNTKKNIWWKSIIFRLFYTKRRVKNWTLLDNYIFFTFFKENLCPFYSMFVVGLIYSNFKWITLKLPLSINLVIFEGAQRSLIKRGLGKVLIWKLVRENS